MALRQIRMQGDDILLKPCKEIKKMDERLRQLIEDMFETMHEAQGVGLAAPQVGVLKRMMIVEVPEGEGRVFINPVILEEEGEQVGYEGCLSIPRKRGIVRRPARIVVEALNENMEPFRIEAEELLARAICHECDHLKGILYTELVEGELEDVAEVPEDFEEEPEE